MIETTIINMPAYTGTVPNKQTQATDKIQYSKDVYNYLSWINTGFIPNAQIVIQNFNSFKVEANALKTAMNQDAQNAAQSATDANTAKETAQQAATTATNAVASLPAGTLDDTVVALDRAWSSSRIKKEISYSEILTLTGAI